MTQMDKIRLEKVYFQVFLQIPLILNLGTLDIN